MIDLAYPYPEIIKIFLLSDYYLKRTNKYPNLSILS